MPKTVGVAVSNATFHFDKLYTYAVMPAQQDAVRLGSMVLVPFGRGSRARMGVVLACDAEPESSKLKYLFDVAPASACLTPELLKLVYFLKERTFCTYYEAVKAVIPYGAQYKPAVAADGVTPVLQKQLTRHTENSYQLAGELPAKPNGHLDVGGAVGKDGVLTVIRDNRLQKEPTVGQVPLVSGEIAEDLTAYYAYSEQVPTVMALGVLVDKDLSILCAGGFMVQLLPGATDAEIDQLEKNIAAMPSVTTLLHEGKTPEDMMQLALAGFDPNVLDERDVHYQCDCSAERTKEMLFSLGRKELVRMRDEDPACEVVCHFCHSKYQYDLNDLLAEYDAQAAERAAAEQGT